LSQWDYDLLPLELAELQKMNVDLDVTGFSAEEILRLLEPSTPVGLTDPDDIPEPPDEPTTRPGDLWLLGRHRLLCGDSAKPQDVDRLLAGAQVHLANTDPPYNVRVEPRSPFPVNSCSRDLATGSKLPGRDSNYDNLVNTGPSKTP
jgi:hypothetical protein